jgi:hypothetical protein
MRADREDVGVDAVIDSGAALFAGEDWSSSRLLPDRRDAIKLVCACGVAAVGALELEADLLAVPFDRRS